MRIRFLGLVDAKKARPTQSHRPALWECILGTVFAMNAEGVVKYFDYDHEAAVRFIGITADSDPRLYRFSTRLYPYRIGTEVNGKIKTGQRILWVRR